MAAQLTIKSLKSIPPAPPRKRGGGGGGKSQYIDPLWEIAANPGLYQLAVFPLVTNEDGSPRVSKKGVVKDNSQDASRALTQIKKKVTLPGNPEDWKFIAQRTAKTEKGADGKPIQVPDGGSQLIVEYTGPALEKPDNV